MYITTDKNFIQLPTRRKIVWKNGKNIATIRCDRFSITFQKTDIVIFLQLMKIPIKRILCNFL